jgi:hypothetical protein
MLALAGLVVVVVAPVAAVAVADLVVALEVDALVVAVVAMPAKPVRVVMQVKQVAVVMLAKPVRVAMLHVQTRVQNHVLPDQPIIVLALNLLNPNQVRRANPIAVVNLDPPQSSPFFMESGRFWWCFTR